MTTGEWLTRWLEGRKASLRPRTSERYASLVRVHIVPAVGHVPLQRLSANDLDRLYAALLVDGHQRAKGESLSPRTVRFVHTVIRKALADALKKRMVTTNVADFAEPPAHRACRPPEMTVWSPAELATFLDATVDHEHGVLFRVAAMTGMRRGELGGLRWRDVDLEGGMLTVRRALAKVAGEWIAVEPKTQASKRTIDLDPATVVALRRQRQALLERHLALGAGWSEHDLVFPALAGGPADLDVTCV